MLEIVENERIVSLKFNLFNPKSFYISDDVLENPKTHKPLQLKKKKKKKSQMSTKYVIGP